MSRVPTVVEQPISRDGTADSGAARLPRVLFVAPVAVDGGVAEVLAGLVRRAAAGGYEPHVVFLRDGPAVARFSAQRPIVLGAGRLRRPDSFLRTVRAIHAIVGRVAPDVVVALEPSAHLYTVGPASWRRIPTVWMSHALLDPKSVIDRVVGRLPSTLVIVNSKFVLERCRDVTGAPVCVLQPGIDVDAVAAGDGPAIRARAGISPQVPLVGIIGRLQAWKGQGLFLEAAAVVSKRFPDAHFVVVGGLNMGWEDTQYPHDLRELATRLGIANRVTFAGHSREVPDWLAAIDVVVHASENEPYGLVICEALAAGRALVSVAQGGPLELVEHERTGLLTSRDAASMAGAIARLLSDEPLRRRLGAAGRHRARDQMSDTRTASNFGAMVRTVIRPSGSRRPSRKRPRVLFVAPVSVQGGANEVLLALANPGEHASYEPLVVALRPGPLIDRLVASNIGHVLLSAPRLRSLPRSVRVMRQLDRIIARWEPDLVFSSEAGGHVYAGLPAARHRVPALWRQPARPDPRNPISFLANRLPARAVAVASNFIAAEQRKVGRRNVAIVRPGIDVERLRGADGPRLRHTRGIAPDDILVTIVGRLQPWKGQDLFLRAAAEVARTHPSARFAVVGGAEMGWEDGDFPGVLRNIAQTLGIEDHVHFAGQTDHVSHWYAASDVIVHASDHEPFGLVLCEAMLMGCAVVASDEGGPCEIIDHEATGLLVPRTVAAIATAMDRLLSDPHERRRLGSAARDAALANFTSARMVRDFEALVREHASC